MIECVITSGMKSITGRGASATAAEMEAALTIERQASCQRYSGNACPSAAIIAGSAAAMASSKPNKFLPDFASTGITCFGSSPKVDQTFHQARIGWERSNKGEKTFCSSGPNASQ